MESSNLLDVDIVPTRGGYFILLKVLPHFQTISLGRRPRPFYHPDWLFEIKWDGFRCLVRIEHARCRLVSRNGNEFKSFSVLNETLPSELRSESAVLDGEIVCLNEHGKPQFRDLLFRRGEPRFLAFDLRACDADDLRYVPVIERKARLRSVIMKDGQRLLFCDHLEHDGEGLYRMACKHDLEGIVAKHKYSPYLQSHAEWLKIRNRDYSQWAGREELFQREREVRPDSPGWDACALAAKKRVLGRTSALLGHRTISPSGAHVR
jgi:ATP dependent DNA ligase domain